MPPLGQQDANFLPPLGIVLHFSYCSIIIVAKKISPETMNKFPLGLCDILESSIFSCTHVINLDYEYEISSEIV